MTNKKEDVIFIIVEVNGDGKPEINVTPFYKNKKLKNMKREVIKYGFQET